MKNPAQMNKILLECGCGCGFLQLGQFTFTDDELYLDYNIRAFDAYQNGAWDRFKRALSIIWTILRGKEYTLYEIVLDTKSEVRAFKNFVANIDETKLIYD